MPKPAGSDWGCGKLPENITVDGYVFLGYFTDGTFTQKITDIPDTTDYENLVIPKAHFKKSTTTSAQDGVFYASGTGTGDGKTAENPSPITQALLMSRSYAQTHSGQKATVNLVSDVTIPQMFSTPNSPFSWNVTIDGNGHSITAEMSSVFYITGGIGSSDTLIVSGTTIKNCTGAFAGGGISLSAGTTINGTTWEDEHWINDEVTATSDLTASSKLWLTN